jgi:arsenate reductase
MDRKLKILFLCTGNSCRSQMAEGWARHLRNGDIEPFSAGIEIHDLDPLAVKVMAEEGVDISDAKPKSVSEFLEVDFDYVITVCDNARETCPFFPGAGKIVHAGFDDPPALTLSMENGEEKLEIYRRVRDEIREFVEGLPGNLDEKE